MSLLSEVLQEVLNPKFVIQSKNELPYFRNAKQAFEYAKANKFKYRKTDEAFELLKDDPLYAYQYVAFFDRFVDGVDILEKTIATSADCSYEYAKQINHVFRLGEKTIIENDPWIAFKYSRDVVRSPWKQAEKTIAKQERAAKAYAKEVLRADFKLDGKLIAKYN